jgi:hypothetical protein
MKSSSTILTSALHGVGLRLLGYSLLAQEVASSPILHQE